MAFDWNAQLQRLNYEESMPRPGESSVQFDARKRREYEQERQQTMNMTRYARDMAKQQQQQQQFQSMMQAATGVGNSSTGAVGMPSSGAPAGSTAAADQAKMEAMRAASMQDLGRERDWWDQDPNAVETRAFAQNQMRGNDVPFTQQVQQGLIGREQDGIASQVMQEQDLIRQRMANQGLGGGGGELRAMVDTRRAGAANQRAASRDIRTRSELENFQARERARGEMSQLMAQEAAQRMRATQSMVDQRSQAHIIRSNEGNVNTLAQAMAAAGGGRGQPGASRSYMPLGALPTDYTGRATGNEPKSSYGGVTKLGVNVGTFKQSGKGQSTGYKNFGLGGANGIWDEYQAADAISNRNMAKRNDNVYRQGTPERPKAPTWAPDRGMERPTAPMWEPDRGVEVNTGSQPDWWDLGNSGSGGGLSGPYETRPTAPFWQPDRGVERPNMLFPDLMRPEAPSWQPDRGYGIAPPAPTVAEQMNGGDTGGMFQPGWWNEPTRTPITSPAPSQWSLAQQGGPSMGRHMLGDSSNPSPWGGFFGGAAGGASYSAPFAKPTPYSVGGSVWDQNQANAVKGSAQSVGSRGHAMWLGERSRFNVR